MGEGRDTCRLRTKVSPHAKPIKKAATDALSLLDWCIEYLANNREGRLASQLARNRRHIRDRLKDQPTRGNVRLG